MSLLHEVAAFTANRHERFRDRLHDSHFQAPLPIRKAQPMMAHKLAQQLLRGPDVPVVCMNVDRYEEFDDADEGPVARTHPAEIDMCDGDSFVMVS